MGRVRRDGIRPAYDVGMPAKRDAPPAPPAGGRQGVYAKGKERRQQILERTLEVYDERGLEGTSLRAIGEAIGVSHAALRHYFASREQLLVEVLREADRRAVDAAEKSGGAVDFLLRGADYSMRVPGLMALYRTMSALALEPGGEYARHFYVERYASLRSRIVTIFEAARAEGSVRSDLPTEEAAAIVIAATDGLIMQWLLDPEVPMRSSMHLLDRLLGASSTN